MVLNAVLTPTKRKAKWCKTHRKDLETGVLSLVCGCLGYFRRKPFCGSRHGSGLCFMPLFCVIQQLFLLFLA